MSLRAGAPIFGPTLTKEQPLRGFSLVAHFSLPEFVLALKIRMKDAGHYLVERRDHSSDECVITCVLCRVALGGVHSDGRGVESLMRHCELHLVGMPADREIKPEEWVGAA